jgi:CBS domain-containing membrane protein
MEDAARGTGATHFEPVAAGAVMGRDFRVENLMSTALVCAFDTDTLGAAHREMELAGIHHLPVIDEHRNLVGILSSTDVVAQPTGLWGTLRVGKCMSCTPVTVTPGMSALQAMDLMLEYGFRSLPVVGSDGHLIGILTETDLVRASRAHLGEPGRPTG